MTSGRVFPFYLVKYLLASMKNTVSSVIVKGMIQFDSGFAFPQSIRPGHDETQEQFLSWFEFSFCLHPTDFRTKAKKPRLSYLIITRRDGFLPFVIALAQIQKYTASSWIWTRVFKSIFTDNNRYSKRLWVCRWKDDYKQQI